MSGEATVRYNNEHNVHVETGLATEEQLCKSVNAFKQELARKFPGKAYDKCEILVNLIVIRGVSCRYAYIWVENPEVYYILCGMNPDGTERIEEINPKENKNPLNLNIDLDLNEMMEELESVEQPKQQKILEPILSLFGYEYTPEQAEIAHKELILEEEKNAIAEEREVRKVEKPVYGFFRCTRSRTTSLDTNQLSNKLRGIVPVWVTESMIRKKFERFATSKELIHFKISFTPEIAKNPGFKAVIVDFGISSKGSGTFALQMTRKTHFLNPATNTSTECVFDYFRDFGMEAVRKGIDNKPKPYNTKPNQNSSTRTNFMNRVTDTGFSNRAVGETSSSDGFQTVRR
jgi:hypothetical protein